MLEPKETVSVQVVEPVLGGVGVEAEFADLLDLELGIEQDHQIERNRGLKVRGFPWPTSGL